MGWWRGLISTASMVLVAACDDGDSAIGAPTFAIALTIEGSGKVAAHQVPIDCHGPADCGTHSISGSAVTLEATPEPGFRFEGWAFDGISNSAEKLDVTGTHGDKRVVVARFVEGHDDEEWPECGP